DPGRRLVVELPAARAQPEHGRADRPAHAHDQGRADGLRWDARAARHPVIDWVTVPEGPFRMGREPHDAFPPDEDEQPRRTVRLEAFRLSRVPVTNRQFHGEGDDRPLTYVSRAEAEAFCVANGVRLPSEEEWEAAARGADDRLWPWGDELPDRSRAIFG